MKKVLLSLLVIAIPFQAYSQYSLKTEYAPWSSSKLCVARTVENFIAMLEMSPSNFESEMQKVLVNVKVGQNYCLIASEQFGSGANYDSPVLIFNKCDDYLSVDWYGSPTAPSVFMKFMADIKDHFLQTKDGMRYYGINYEGRDYTFRFKRFQEQNTMFEMMTIWRVKN